MNIKQVKCLEEQQAMKKAIIFYRETEEWKSGTYRESFWMLPTLCHTQNAGKMTKKNPLAFDHSFQLLLLHYLLRTCSLPDISDTDVNKVCKGHDTYIPSSITYNLKSGNGTITAPTWWDWYENEVNTCSALKAMLV